MQSETVEVMHEHLKDETGESEQQIAVVIDEGTNALNGSRGSNAVLRQPWIEFLREYLNSNDFKELVGCVLAGILFYTIGFAAGMPRDRGIPVQKLTDGSYAVNQMYAEISDGDTVPDWALGLVAALCLLVQGFLSLTVGAKLDLHRTICVYFLALPCTKILTLLIKNYVGYLRPQFYQECNPSNNYEYCQDEVLEKDMRSSFPSGHASLSFVSLGLLYLYLERMFGISSIERAYIAMPIDTSSSMKDDGNVFSQAFLKLRYTGQPRVYRFISMLCALPLILAGFIASSRVADNRHHPADVVAGSLIGASVAYFYHHSWFQDPRFFS